MMEFPKKYKFKDSEPKWQKFWQEQNIYIWDKNIERKNTYVVDTPPPTVSGQLHIGHVYSYTHTDFIVRFKRMSGMNVFYPMGFDDNGLPTERLVEKKRNLKASNVSRQEFIDICHEVIIDEEEKFRQLFKSIALSVDWNIEYRTITPESRKISQMSFLDLVSKEQVYRASEPILWDPVDRTALAQADIEDKEKQSFMNDIKFFTEEGKEIIIATTRPEMLPACAAIFYHPDDERYKNLAGKYAISPLFNVKVPLLADDMVNPEKGTGLVMCCTFGDQTDISWWRKHHLPCKIIITKYGTISDIEFDDNCQDIEKADKFAKELTGLKITAARKKILELLTAENLLVRQEEISQTVKSAERSGAPLEIITTVQWFIKTIEHKEMLMQRTQELNWHPKTMKIKLENWINSIAWDWCISRQRYFGVPFPVWYSKRPGEEGKPIFATAEQLPVDPLVDLPEGYSREEVEPDLDVMDTWATSSVSPQLSSQGIAKGFMVDEERHKKLFPMDLRPQAHEILRTWGFYTIFKADLHENTLPWNNIMISGWCLAEDRSKMSKSKGNIVVPEKILEQYGADLIRYWSASSKLGADTAYSENVISNGKRLVNKLWNAAKFASQHFDKLTDAERSLNLEQLTDKITADFDKYFLSRLKDLVINVTEEFEKYEYAAAMSLVEKFFWAEFCDNYLEITKTRAYDEDNNDPKGSLSSRITLYHTVKILLQLFAPFMPHITEELYQILYVERDVKESIHNKGNWPDISKLKLIDVKEGSAKDLLIILELVRKIKAYDNLSIKAGVKYIEVESKGSGLVNSKSLLNDLKNVTASEEIRFVNKLTNDKQQLTEDKISINVVYIDDG